jgi:RimJ/RimL family protein N-acetyltransferase
MSPPRRLSHWPLYDLRLRTERLELRLPDTALLEEMVDLVGRGIHPEATMPFGVPWTDRPSPQREREAVQHVLRSVAEWTAKSWLYLAVAIWDGRVVGVQDLRGIDFPACRMVRTGSWLGREHQGQGLGQEMRAAVLELAFAHLGALEAQSAAFHDNASSIAVSRRLGYQPNGSWLAPRRGRPDRMVGFRLTREEWERHRRHRVTVSGVEACLELFGAGESTAAQPPE